MVPLVVVQIVTASVAAMSPTIIRSHRRTNGEMLVTAEGDVSYIAISGGFLEVLANKVIVLADTAERSDEIDIDRAEAALKRAQDAVIDKPEQVNLSMALASIRKSQARVKVARRRTRLAKGIGSKGSA